MNASEWFHVWLKLHKGINPHGRFADYESPGHDQVYAGWIEWFDREEVRRDEAASASRAMQAMDRRQIYPEHHLAILLGLIRRARASAGPSNAEQARLAKLSWEVERREREQDELTKAWNALDEQTRREYRDYIRAIYPRYLCQLKHWLEGMARYCWADVIKGAGYRPYWFPPDEPEGESPAVVGPISLRSYLAEAPGDRVIDREKAGMATKPTAPAET